MCTGISFPNAESSLAVDVGYLDRQNETSFVINGNVFGGLTSLLDDHMTVGKSIPPVNGFRKLLQHAFSTVQYGTAKAVRNSSGLIHDKGMRQRCVEGQGPPCTEH